MTHLPYTVKFGSLFPKIAGHDCLTFRRTIYCRHRWITAHTLAHEYEHVRQYHEYGVMVFLVRYFWEQLRHGYKGNRFELLAHAYADAHESEFQGIP